MKSPAIKKQVLDKINSLIENCSNDESEEKLLLLNKIKIGIEQAKSGKTTSEAKKSLKKYLAEIPERKSSSKK